MDGACLAAASPLVAALAALALCAPATASAADCAGSDLVPARRQRRRRGAGHALPAQPAARRARRGTPGRERDPHHRLGGLLAADGRAGLLRPRVARRRHAGRSPDRRRLPRRRGRMGRGGEHRLGPGHARHGALDGHAPGWAAPATARTCSAATTPRSAWGWPSGRRPTRPGAPPTPPTSEPARRRRARPPSRQGQRGEQGAQEGQARRRLRPRGLGAPRRALGEAALVDRLRPLGACPPPLNIRLAPLGVSYPRCVMPRALPIAALLALAVALVAPAARLASTPSANPPGAVQLSDEQLDHALGDSPPTCSPSSAARRTSAHRVAGLRLLTEDKFPEVYVVLASWKNDAGQHVAEDPRADAPQRPHRLGARERARRPAHGPHAARRQPPHAARDALRPRAQALQRPHRRRQGLDADARPGTSGSARSSTSRARRIYGPRAIGTSAYAPTLSDWPGGGVVGLHGTNQPGLIPGRPSHGCIRLRNRDILTLYRLAPKGTPVDIL